MADKSRLYNYLKKAVIPDKLGLELSKPKSEQRESSKSEAPRSEQRFSPKNQAIMDKFLAPFKKEKGGERKQPSSSPFNFNEPASSMPSMRPSRSGVSSGMGIYIGLIAISIMGLILKNFIAYSPFGSLVISIILGLFFLIAVHYTPESGVKITLVWITFGLDTLSQFVLGLFPDSEIKNMVITFHVFAWVILSIVLFLVGIFDTLGAGQHLGLPAIILLIFIVSLILYILLPLIAGGVLSFQDLSHSEYFNIAKTEISKIGLNFKDIKNSWVDYTGCTFSAASAAVTYEKCLQDKKISRFCKSSTKTDSEFQNCVKQQNDIAKRGPQPGVAGSVSDAIKQVTSVNIAIDDYFPKKTTEARKLYPVTLEVKNPRELKFGARMSCAFKTTKAGIVGKIFVDGEDKDEISIGDRDKKISVGCQPSIDLKGRYTIQYNATLFGLQTFSFLKRAFASKQIDPKLRDQIIADNFKSKDKSSQGPNEFALLNFKFGTGEGTEPLVLVDEPVTFSFSVADVSGGSVLNLNSYNFIGLSERGFQVDQLKIGEKDCLSGAMVFVTEQLTKKREPSELKRCFLQLPADLQALTENQFEIETFIAEMNYDYRITKSVTIDVTPLDMGVNSS